MSPSWSSRSRPARTCPRPASRPKRARRLTVPGPPSSRGTWTRGGSTSRAWRRGRGIWCLRRLDGDDQSREGPEAFPSPESLARLLAQRVQRARDVQRGSLGIPRDLDSIKVGFFGLTRFTIGGEAMSLNTSRNERRAADRRPVRNFALNCMVRLPPAPAGSLRSGPDRGSSSTRRLGSS